MVVYAKQQGLTLLEVLIALSIFAMIGVSSTRLLSTVIESQKINERHSQSLSQTQRAMAIISRDLQYLASRPIRAGADNLDSLLIGGDRPIEFTRSGWFNPLQAQRSQLQRVAYDIGLHPKRADPKSPYYNSDVRYLRRHYWQHLDRLGLDQQPVTQLLMANVNDIEITVISDDGMHTQWPLPKSTGASASKKEPPKLKGISLQIQHNDMGLISRLFNLN